MGAIAETLRIEIPIETIDRTEPGLSRMKKGFRDLDAAARQAQKSTRQVGGQGSQYERTSQRTQRSTQSWMKQKFQAVLEAKDKVTPVVKSALSIVKSLAGKTWKITLKAFDMVTAPIRKVFNMLKSPLMAAGITLSAGAGVANTVKTFSSFEAGMSRVKAISGANAEEFEKLNAKAKQMGATTKFTATESAEALNYMAMAGWKTEDMLGGIEGIMNLAAASGESLGTTSDIVTDALTAFGMQANEAGMFADVLAATATNSNTDVAMLGESFKYVAPVCGSLGYSAKDTALALGVMANSGNKASTAGTSLRSVLTNMAKPTDAMQAAMDELGVSLTDEYGKMKSLRQVLDDLRTGFGQSEMPQEELTAAINKMETAYANGETSAEEYEKAQEDLMQSAYGVEGAEKAKLAAMLAGKTGMSGLLSIVNASEKDYLELADAIEGSNGAAEEMSDIMMDNLSGSFAKFTSALGGVKLSLGEKFSPYLRGMLDWLTAQMPKFEDKLLRAFDSIEEKMKSLKEKIKEFTGTDEWENADFFGKVEIAWDELIAQPFTEWWNSTGKGMMSMMARSIGEGAGSALRFGLLALLGFDLSGVEGEAASVGKSFVAGFSKGLNFDEIKGKLWDGIGNLFSSAGKLLPGGEKADFGSLMSAALLARVANPLLALGGRGVSLGRAAVGAGGTILGSAAAGTGLRGLGASAGMIGLKLGSNATGAGLVASGAGAVAGGAIGGATLISGVLDLYKGAKSEDKEEATAYNKSGGWKVSGVVAGATIGSILGPIGALVGAGIGGIAGWFKGEDVKKEYEEKKKAAEEAAAAEELMNQKAKYASKNARFETEALNEAFKDTTLSAEEFGAMVQEAASDKMKQRFGDIKLSMKEIEELAKQITMNGKEEQFATFSTAAAQAESSMQSFQQSVSTMDKLNWKASLGIELSESDIEAYKTGVDAMVQNAIKYLEDKHYKATAAISLLVEPENREGILNGIDSMYADLQEQLNSAQEELKVQTNIALEDGTIDVNEQQILTDLQNQVMQIINDLSQAELEANFARIKIKYTGNGAQLDVASFTELMSEVKEQVKSQEEALGNAFTEGMTAQNFQLKQVESDFEIGEITFDEYEGKKAEIQKNIQLLEDDYQLQLSNLNISSEGFLVQTIADAFSKDLDGILPELEGTTAEKLSQATRKAIASGVDVSSWGTPNGVASAVEWLGLENVEGSTQAAVAGMMSQVGDLIPEALKNSMNGLDGIFSADGLISKFSELVGEVTGIDFSPFSNVIETIFSGMFEHGAEKADQAPLFEPVKQEIEELNNLELPEMPELGSIFPEQLARSAENIDMSGVTEVIQSKVTEPLSSVDLSNVESVDMSGLSTGITTSMESTVGNLDFSSVSSSIGSGIASAINSADMGQINSAIAALKSNVGSAINSAFAGGFQTTTTVTITANYKLANPTATINFSGGGSGSATVSASIGKRANGGFVNGAELSWIGEDGPEAVIPLGAKRRSRGLALWQKAGELLGVAKHAEGGIINPSNLPITAMGTDIKQVNDAASSLNGSRKPLDIPLDKVTEQKEAVGVEGTSIEKENTPQKTEVNVSVNVNPKFEVPASQNTDDVLRVIRGHMREIADELGGEIAERLGEVFSNMPIKAM